MRTKRAGGFGWSRPLALWLALAVFSGPKAHVSAADPKPNIVLILADDLGWGDVSFQGRKAWTTPNLDRLAARGTSFSRAYTAAVVCAPSRAALLTGKDPIHNGVSRNDDDLPASEVTIAEALKAQGYMTALSGKWHRGKPRPGASGFVHPLDQGFDESFGFTDAVHAWEKFPEFLWDGRKKVDVTGYADDLFADRAVAYLKQSHDRPFFLYLAFTNPHFNIEAPEREVARHKGAFHEENPAVPLNATYAAMVTRLDHNVGRVLDALDGQGLAKNTLVLFSSDHGATFESGNLGASDFHDSNQPFRGQKRTLWEGGIRVPLLACWPDRIAPGVVRDAPVRLTDLFPTILAAAGATPDPSWRIDGQDLLPALTGGRDVTLPERTLFWEWRSEGANQLAALRGRYKLVITRAGKPELYDVVADPAERRDVAGKHPDLARRLKTELDAWLKTESREGNRVGATTPHS